MRQIASCLYFPAGNSKNSHSEELSMADNLALSAETLAEALSLAGETLNNIELSQVPLHVAMLKASRLSRLVGDTDHQRAFEYEASGYPAEPSGVPPEAFELGRLAGRVTKTQEKEGPVVERISLEAVELIEQRIASSRIALEAARDPNVSVSSSNPNQYVFSPSGNAQERTRIQHQLSSDTKLLAGRRAFVHRHVSKTYDELRFSSIAQDIFSRIRGAVDSSIGEVVPQAVQKFASVYENLRSNNPEDWANAVHTCRRILQDLADTLFPPTHDRISDHGGKPKTIKLGPDNYINRLVCFIEENSASDRFNAIVGSTLGFIGDRLDAAFQAAQKGSHSEIATREEADRYVVYTYMLVADIISLRQDRSAGQTRGLNTDFARELSTSEESKALPDA
jgi:hypothetical protein